MKTIPFRNMSLVHKEKRYLEARTNLSNQFKDWFYEERKIKSKTNHKQKSLQADEI